MKRTSETGKAAAKVAATDNGAIAQNSEQAERILKKESELPAKSAEKELTPAQKRLKELDAERKELLAAAKAEKAAELEKRKAEKKAADEAKLKEKEAAEKEAAAKKAEAEAKIGAAEKAHAKLEEAYREIKAKYDSSLVELKALRLALNPKAAKKGTGKRASKGTGVIASIAQLIEESKSGITKEEILENLIVRFPENDPDSMMGTIKAQVPYRINKERFLIEKDSEGRWHKI